MFFQRLLLLLYIVIIVIMFIVSLPLSLLLFLQLLLYIVVINLTAVGFFKNLKIYVCYSYFRWFFVAVAVATVGTTPEHPGPTLLSSLKGFFSVAQGQETFRKV